MVRWEEMERNRARREAERAAVRRELVENCGTQLGESILNYLYPDLGTTWEQLIGYRQELAEAVIDVFERGSREDKVSAVTALFQVIETKTGQVLSRVERDALHRVTPIGNL